MSNINFENVIDNSDNLDNKDELYDFDIKKFKELMCDKSNTFESSELVGKIIKSFNIESFSFYSMLKSLDHCRKKYESLSAYFEYAWYYLIKAFLICEENVEQSSEQIIKLNKKLDELWDSIPDKFSIKLEP